VLPVVPPEHLTGQDGEGAIQAATDDLAALSAPTRKLAEVTTGSPCSR
jgi:hypothetical protein